MGGFPANAVELNVEWLKEALDLDSLDGYDATRMSGGFWSHMVRLHLSLAPATAFDDQLGMPPTLVAKFANPSDQARFICATFEFNRTELGFYRDVATETRTRTPHCYAAVGDDQFNDYVLLMEDLGSTQIDQLAGCSVTDAASVVDALADLHSQWWDHPNLAQLDWLHRPGDPTIVERLAAVMSMISDQAFANLNDCPQQISDAWPALMDQLPTLLERLDDQPATLAHGDVRLSNLFLLPTSSGSVEVGFVDWQATRHSHGCYDLAYFLTQSLDTDVRRRHELELIERYRNRLINNEVDAPSLEQLTYAYKLCALYCLVYPIIAASSAESSNSPEALQIAERAFSSVIDLGALELIS